MRDIEKLDELKVKASEALNKQFSDLKNMIRSKRFVFGFGFATVLLFILGALFGDITKFEQSPQSFLEVLGSLSLFSLFVYVGPIFLLGLGLHIGTKSHRRIRKSATIPLIVPLFRRLTQHNRRVDALKNLIGMNESLQRTDEPNFAQVVDRQIEQLGKKKQEIEVMCRFFEAAKDVKIGEFDALGDIFTEEVPELGMSLRDSFEDTLRKLSAHIDVDSSLNGIESLDSVRRRKLGNG